LVGLRLIRAEELPEGPDWLVELRFDGYRARAIKDGGKGREPTRMNTDQVLRFAFIRG
jgi:ATP-dependent DNA ligase